MSNTSYKIERNVPYPSRFHTNEHSKEYPLEQMKVGDSFLVPFTKSKSCPRHINISYTKAKLLGMKVSCRTEDKGVRIWRIK